MAINIVVNDDYKITSDSMQVIVNRKHIVDPTKSPNWAKRAEDGADPTPREEWREVAYFGNLEKALNWIVEQTQRDSNAQSMVELLEETKAIRKEIKAVLSR